MNIHLDRETTVNSMKRFLTAIALISVLFGIMIMDYYFVYGSLSIYAANEPHIPIFSEIFLWLLLAISIFELYSCYSKSVYNLFKAPLILLAVSIYPVFFVMEFFTGHGIYGILLALAASAILELILFTFADKEKYSSKDLFAEFSIIIYPTLLVSFALILGARFSGIYVIMFATFLAVAGDTFAYWFGKSLHNKFPKKMCPTISPKKTVVGAIGGVVGSIFAAMVFWAFFEVGGISSTANMSQVVAGCNYTLFFPATQISDLWRSGLVYAAMGIIGAALSEVGDLAASRIKRSIGIKDFGTIFPGHGGVIDRLDSIMFALVLLAVVLPIVYLS